jgi:hypothetical protein
MGFAMVLSPCLGCGAVFAYNPHRVPSKDLDGQGRKPICRSCMSTINAARRIKGLEPFTIHPDAYEAIDEHEL